MAGVFSVVLAIAAVVFLVVAAGVVYSVVRYRSRGLSTQEPRQIFGSRKLEVLWTVVPLLIVTGLFIVTVLGAFLTFGPVGLYPVYLHSPTYPWGLDPESDRQLGGLLMWVPCCFVYLSGILAAVMRWYGAERTA